MTDYQNPMANFRFMDRQQDGPGPTEEELKRLKAPFPSGAIEWVVTAFNTDKTRGLLAPYCNWTVYMHQLDEIFGTDWNFEVQYLNPGMSVMLVHLTIRGITRTQIVTKAEGTDQSVMWSSGFRRACATWGLGAYLYHAIPKTWARLKNAKYIEESELPRLKRIAQDFTDNWAKALEEGLMNLVAVSADPTPDFDDTPQEPAPPMPQAPKLNAVPPMPQAPPEPAHDEVEEAVVGIVEIGLPKAKKLTGLEKPTFKDVLNAGDEGKSYLEWVAKSGPDNLRPLVEKFLNAASAPEPEPQPAPSQPAEPQPAPVPDKDGVVATKTLRNMTEFFNAVKELDQWKEKFPQPGALFFFCKEQFGWPSAPSDPDDYAKAIAWLAQHSPE